MPVICVENVKKAYGPVRVLDGVNLVLDRGDLCALVGPSGCGKTTFLNILGALDRPSSGLVLLDGIEVSALPEKELYRVRRDKVGFIFQLYYLINSLRAWENVVVPGVPWGLPGGPERARKLLALVGLTGKEDRRPGRLSGGEQQRVAIARALLMDPPIIVADEPTGNLDRETGQKIMRLMRRLADELGKAIVIATHDREVAKNCRKVIDLGGARGLTSPR